jgi:hypothetical protein
MSVSQERPGSYAALPFIELIAITETEMPSLNKNNLTDENKLYRLLININYN